MKPFVKVLKKDSSCIVDIARTLPGFTIEKLKTNFRWSTDQTETHILELMNEIESYVWTSFVLVKNFLGNKMAYFIINK